MKKNYMLKRLVCLYSRLGVVVSVNVFGVVRLHHDRIKDDCYYPSITKCYELTFGNDELNPDIDGYRFYDCYPDGKIDTDFPF